MQQRCVKCVETVWWRLAARLRASRRIGHYRPVATRRGHSVHGYLFTENMQSNDSLVRAAAVLEDVDALPGSERGAAPANGDGELTLGEGGPDVSRHVVGTFHGVGVEAVVLGDKAAEEGFEISDDIGVGVFLDQQRGGGVSEEDGEEAFLDAETLDPGAGLSGDFVETLTAGWNSDLTGELPHESM